ncbi:autotransporter assembly complex family protein [Granulosicoccaceae sp. 1_MG-2023]|nr:autotransporter assembly complex family protein [Granulosicoccaceae sp. 1_MG-2023]
MTELLSLPRRFTRPFPCRSPARRRKRYGALLAGLVALFHAAAQAAVRVDIDGVEGALRDNVALYIGEPATDNPLTVATFVRELPGEVRDALQALGYYHSDVDVTLSESKNGKDQLIRVAIAAGRPVRVSKMQVTLKGDALNDSAFTKALQDLPLKQGDVLNHGLYEKTKSRLFDLAQDRGYFDAAYEVSRVDVRRATRSAEVTLTFNAGTRYRIGQVRFDSDLFDANFLQRWVPFSEGDYYLANDIAEFTQRLQSSDYFSRVRVRTRRNEADGDRVPVDTELTAAADNSVAFGVGFATDTGPRTKLTWRRPHTNRHGHSLDISTGISDVRQEFSAQYKIPRQSRPHSNYFLIDYGALNEDTEDTRSQLRTLSFQRVRQTSRKWQESVFVRWEHEKFEASDENDTINLILPGISYARTLSQGGANPTRGSHIGVQFLGGSTRLFSDIDMFKSTLQLKWLRTLMPKHKVLASLAYGAISTDSFSRVPSSHRFYVGGDRSIRGFRYHSLSPEDEDGDLVGGRYMETGSLEYDYTIFGRWSVAAFVDAGRAFDHFDAAYHVGTGGGVRWQSPVGPIRLDIAFGVSEDDIPVRFHISVGPDL